MFRVLVAVLVLVTAAVGTARGQPECICLEELPDARDFTNPLIIISAEDQTDRLFIGKWCSDRLFIGKWCCRLFIRKWCCMLFIGKWRCRLFIHVGK